MVPRTCSIALLQACLMLWALTASAQRRESAAPSPIPTGVVLALAAAPAPTGYLVCDGSLHNERDFPRLARVLQRTYCTASAPCGAGEFRVPDLRGRVVVGTGTGSGLTPRGLGDAFGSETHVLTVAEMPAHNHRIGRQAQINMGGPGAELTQFEEPSRPEAFTQSTGGGQPHAIVQPSISLTYIIKD